MYNMYFWLLLLFIDSDCVKRKPKYVRACSPKATWRRKGRTQGKNVVWES